MRLRICLAGASLGTGNRGVEALGRSVIDAIDTTTQGSLVSVFDDGWGVRADDAGRYSTTTVENVGVRVSRRWYRPESWARIRAAQFLGSRGNEVARRIVEADAVLDISGGDSFTDLYGPHRFRIVAAPKKAAIRVHRPLVLLPQTYGPFASDELRDQAASLVRSARVCYARDTHSYERLLNLAGPDTDPESLRQGVDVAFALRPRRPDDATADEIDRAADDGLLVGMNVSGLLKDDEAQAQFGLAGDYLPTMAETARQLISRGCLVLFTPHVQTSKPGGENDFEATTQVRSMLSEKERARTMIAALSWGAAELKWAISRCAWFVGSRMHSTIAALSSCVPAVGYAYSDKTLGVFASAGVGDWVVDARRSAGLEAAEQMITAFDRREAAKQELVQAIPAVTRQAEEQIRRLLFEIDSWRSPSSTLPRVASQPGQKS